MPLVTKFIVILLRIKKDPIENSIMSRRARTDISLKIGS